MSIYVSNFYDVEDYDIKRVFAEYGTVKNVQVPKSQTTGKKKGFAIVEMESHAEEMLAVQMLRNRDWMCRVLKKVNKEDI